jgi:integrase
VESSVDKVSNITELPMPQARSQIPTDQELAAFIDEIKTEWLFRYIVIALNTWARPEAILELDVSKQVNFTTGLIDLNQRGRRQNNEVRPLIRLTNNLRGWLLYWRESKPINRDGEPVLKIRHSEMRAIWKRAGACKITPYTLRHYCATRIRQLPEPLRPAREERSA